MITVVIFIPWFHPAYKAGGPVQSIANMVSQFSENISYKIICSNADLGGNIIEVDVDKWMQYNSNTQVWYSSKERELPAILKRETNYSTDILFINGIYSWYFNLYPLLFCKAQRKIVSVRGMLHPGALSQKHFKKSLYLFLWKVLRLPQKFDFHASNNEEKKYIQNVFGKKVKIFIAQNFPRKIVSKAFPEKKQNSLLLLSIALISPMKNYLLILKALMNCKSFIQYDIYGPVKDKGYWDVCLKQIERLPENISVKYHGDATPDKIEKILTLSHVFILPSKSENFGHAIFEALSAGKPVITTNNTPWKNLEDSNAGINISEESADELNNAIDKFAVMGQKEFEEWSINATQYAAQAVNVEEIKLQYKHMFFE